MRKDKMLEKSHLLFRSTILWSEEFENEKQAVNPCNYCKILNKKSTPVKVYSFYYISIEPEFIALMCKKFLFIAYMKFGIITSAFLLSSISF